jgi:hypothetical protein
VNFGGGDFPVEHEAILLNAAAPATCDWIEPEASLGETMEIDTEAVDEVVPARFCRSKKIRESVDGTERNAYFARS